MWYNYIILNKSFVENTQSSAHICTPPNKKGEFHMNETINFAGRTHDNQNVYYSKRKFKQFSDVQKNLIAEALPRISYKDFQTIYTFCFNRIVGSTSLVEVEDYQKDRVFWVYRKSNTKWRVPVLFNGVQRNTTYMTIMFESRDNKVFIIDCYFGKRVPPVLGNPKSRRKGADFAEKCQNFWQNHALVIPQDAIDIPRTLCSLNEEEYDRFMEFVNQNNA